MKGEVPDDSLLLQEASSEVFILVKLTLGCSLEKTTLCSKSLKILLVVETKRRDLYDGGIIES